MNRWLLSAGLLVIAVVGGFLFGDLIDVAGDVRSTTKWQYAEFISGRHIQVEGELVLWSSIRTPYISADGVSNSLRNEDTVESLGGYFYDNFKLSMISLYDLSLLKDSDEKALIRPTGVSPIIVLTVLGQRGWHCFQVERNVRELGATTNVIYHLRRELPHEH